MIYYGHYDIALDDIDNLVLNGKSRLDETGEYDISYYEKIIKENVLITGKLILEIQKSIEKMQKQDNKETMAYLTNRLVEAYKVFAQTNVREEYENSPFSKEKYSEDDYYTLHPYAKFIDRDFPKKIGILSRVIGFMQYLYNWNKTLKENGDVDSSLVWDVFLKTKEACNLLGIHCPDSVTLYESISKGLINDNNDNNTGKMTSTIVDDDSLKNDIVIQSLPYTVSVPYFVYKPFLFEFDVSFLGANVLYNKSYLEKLQQDKYNK